MVNYKCNVCGKEITANINRTYYFVSSLKGYDFTFNLHEGDQFFDPELCDACVLKLVKNAKYEGEESEVE